jgi:hypothetical protein
MSDAADRLAQTRLAIINQIQSRDHRQEGREARGRRGRDTGSDEAREHEPEENGGGRFGQLRHAIKTWWRYHPAHLGLELATPALSAYAERKPLQYLGIAAALGAVIMIARPWRLISVTGLLVGIAKSSQVSGLLLSALSAADFQKDHEDLD